jgi:hypothetical protein
MIKKTQLNQFKSQNHNLNYKTEITLYKSNPNQL